MLVGARQKSQLLSAQKRKQSHSVQFRMFCVFQHCYPGADLDTDVNEQSRERAAIFYVRIQGFFSTHLRPTLAHSRGRCRSLKIFETHIWIICATTWSYQLPLIYPKHQLPNFLVFGGHVMYWQVALWKRISRRPGSASSIMAPWGFFSGRH